MHSGNTNVKVHMFSIKQIYLNVDIIVSFVIQTGKCPRAERSPCRGMLIDVRLNTSSKDKTLPNLFPHSTVSHKASRVA